MLKKHGIVKILCISDIHGNKSLAEYILTNTEHDISLSMGDTELDDSWVKSHFTYAIAGNNDFSSSLGDYSIVKIFDYKIFMTHGHLFGGYNTLMNYELLLKATSKLDDINLFAFGHSHFPLFFNEQNNEKAFLNPGSITYPRFGSEPSFAIINLNIDNNKIEKVEFINPTKIKK
ncbi:metallophosphoesterase family protein [Mycoplasma crocodyli]|uniref:Phosphoesterase n=1 Tax=Mycoplasma crocodyli (strain ATCC 51981 / MP145) TaxID=512564 RepID=D5E4Q9_MYCCM|nr:YfcE family phosphodiesterase [Mycoplasma crocodyli]ADE19563.1 phosphodiesterase I [Mycoplasma crocodyli MP145]